MRIFVKAKTRSKEYKVKPPQARLWQATKERDGTAEEDYYTVCVKEPPIQGKANKAIIKTIAEYFKIPISRVILLSGMSSDRKVFEIIK